MRIAVGALILECNSFSPLRSDLEYFKDNGFLLWGNEIPSYHRGIRNEMAGFLDSFSPDEVQWQPTCAAWAVPHGPVDRRTFDHLKSEICRRFASALPLDGVYLALHGSMLVEGIDDPEGDLLSAVRRVIGGCPLVASLDFHANLTRCMVEMADGIVGYNSFPHDNLYESGQRSSVLLRRIMASGVKPARVFVKIPVIAPVERMTVADNTPIRRIIDRLDELEKAGFPAASFFGVQPWLDVPEMGSSVLIVADDSRVREAESEAAALARWFWSDREYFFDFDLYRPEEAIAAGLATDARPVLLNEPADNVGSGATGDGTFLLRALLERGVHEPTILTIRDPAAVKEAVRAGAGRTIELEVGGKLNTANDSPLRVRGTVRTIFDGRYTYRGPVYHGVTTSMGTTVVLEIDGHIAVQITSLPVYTIDPEHYRCVGLFPERSKFVGIKSQGSYKASYNDISRTVYFLDTPGISSSNILGVPFTRIDRNRTYPFNRDLEYSPEPVIIR